jgi:hypothetical protein
MSTVEQDQDVIDPEFSVSDEVDQTLPPDGDLSQEAADQAETILKKKLAHLEEIEALRRKIREEMRLETKWQGEFKLAKKRRERIEQLLADLIDQGWDGEQNLPLDGDVQVNGSASTPPPAHRTGEPVTMETPIAQVGFDSDLMNAIETIQQDYPITNLGEMGLWLDKQPTDKRSAYLTSGHESAIQAMIDQVKESCRRAIAEDESWKAVAIDVLAEGEKGVSEAVLACLRKREIETIGDLAAWTASGKQLADLDGIGKAKAERIEDAMEAFWRRRKRGQ